MSLRPRPGKDYRILAVRDARHTALVGKVFTPESINHIGWPDHMWSVSGRVHGQPGTVSLVAALGRESGQCYCAAYTFPHARTRNCK